MQLQTNHNLVIKNYEDMYCSYSGIPKYTMHLPTHTSHIAIMYGETLV